MRINNNSKRRILSIFLIFLILINTFNFSKADSNTIYIESLEDLVSFSKNASLDSYYDGKTVLLERDLNLSGLNDFSIPTFSGTFDGQGHTISGLNISKKASNQGLFRYLQESGSIKNLSVSGRVLPSGSKNIVAGLVGHNSGNISNCHFDGLVEARNNVGGIAGINEASGVISNVSSKAEVNGEHFVGGIVGQNLGSIFKSTNLGKVNTKINEESVSLDDIDWNKINSAENVSAYTDTGGITGLSTGYIQDCVNRGEIGYRQIGYNVGGIVGRQSGYLANCKNYNTVLGRKDVGGIVGQIEPYISLVFSEDTLQKLDRELNLLQSLLSGSFENARSSSKSISNEVDNILNAFDASMSSVEVLSQKSLDYADEVTDTVNISLDRSRYTLEELSDILKDAKELSTSLKSGLDFIDSGFSKLQITSDEMADALDESQGAISKLRKAIDSGEASLSEIEKILNRISNLIKNTDSNEASFSIDEKDLNDLHIEIDSYKRSLLEGSEAVESISSRLESLGNSKYIKDLIDAAKDISQSINSIAEDLDAINRAVLSLINDNFLASMFDSLFDKLHSSSKNLDASLLHFSKTLKKLKDTSEQAGDAFEDFSLGFNKFSDSSESMTIMLGSMKDLLDSLNSMTDLELPSITSEYRQSGDDLFRNISDMSSGLADINSKMLDASNSMVNDIDAVNSQVRSIFNLLIESMEDVNKDNYKEDISAQNINKQELGSLYKNENFGQVKGAVNTGGIAGSLAIEYDLDPEDDIFKKGNRSLNFKFFTSSIIKDCQNHAKISGKKDYTGGIVGRMDLGIVSDCENYGDIESEDGDYLGGIAGASSTSITNSYVLASLSGRNYIGGIAGLANNISNSYSLIDLDKGFEFTGAIAGDIDGDINNNYFVHDRLAAIDGISYSKKAAPISYETLLGVDSLPQAFRDFKISFIVDGEIVKEYPFEYGDNFDMRLLPNIPEKKDHYAYWEDFNNQNMHFSTMVEAVYEPLITTISSNITREDTQLDLVLAEGSFNRDVKLKISPGDINKEKFSAKSNNFIEAWEVDLLGLDDRDEVSYLRLNLPDKDNKYDIWEDSPDGFKKIKSTTEGSYIVFPMERKSSTFIVAESSSYWLLGLLLAIILLVFFFLLRFLKGKDEIDKTKNKFTQKK